MEIINENKPNDLFIKYKYHPHICAVSKVAHAVKMDKTTAELNTCLPDRILQR